MSAITPADARELLERPAGRRSAMLLAGCGFAAPRRAGEALAAMAAAGGGREALAAMLPELMAGISASADPDAAAAGLSALVAAAGPAGGRGLLQRLAAGAEARRMLLGLLGSSRAFSAALVRWPEWAGELVSPRGARGPRKRDELAAELAGLTGAAGDCAGRMAALRRFRRRELLGIAARDAAGRSDLATATAEISALAEAVVELALASARTETGEAAASLAVLGLGKLGGGELNYSSDIDLIFITADHGPGPARLAGELLRQLTEPTADGVAYRVDLRLRPEGARGALVWERGAALAYYRTRARAWERQALVKARPVAGDLALGRAFLDDLAGFVWQRGLGPVEVARACQLRTEMERAAGADGAAEVKSGAGGIRDVEFAVQILQLAHGAEHPELRRTGTLEALEAVERLGLAGAEQVRQLRAGYEFLRRVEHCLQTMDELAMHAVPAGAAERAALARRLGYAGSPEAARREFEADLARHSAQVRSVYAELCGQGASGANLAGRLEEVLAAGDDSELVALLSVLGFGGGRQSAALVRALAARTPAGPAGLAAILDRLRAGPGPDRGLANLERLAGAELLGRVERDAGLREALLAVAERSDFLAGLLAGQPELSGALVPGAAGRARRGRVRLAEDFRRATGGLSGREELVAALAGFRQGELLRVGARDLLDGEEPGEVSAELSCLAELVLERALAAAGVPGRVAVLALGRLGGRELSYGSDLDLVFVDTGPAADADRPALDAVRLLEAAGYQVDTRLRPAGSAGQLLATLSGYRAYRDRGELAVWERLALVRARPVGGSEAARAELLAFLDETLYGAEPEPDLAARTWDMRLRLERTAGEGDFKRGPGGLVDLEFLAEFLALAHGRVRPALRRLGVGETFAAAAAEGLLPRAEAARAAEAHRFLRRLEMRARVVVGRAVSSLPAEPEELARLARMMGPDAAADPVGELRREFERQTSAARKLLERTVRG